MKKHLLSSAGAVGEYKPDQPFDDDSAENQVPIDDDDEPIAPSSSSCPSVIQSRPAAPATGPPSAAAQLDPLIPDRQVAKHFGVNPKTIKRWSAKADLGFAPPVVINGRTYRRAADIEQFKIRAAARAGRLAVA